jgi:hypothetical protein
MKRNHLLEDRTNSTHTRHTGTVPEWPNSIHLDFYKVGLPNAKNTECNLIPKFTSRDCQGPPNGRVYQRRHTEDLVKTSWRHGCRR